MSPRLAPRPCSVPGCKGMNEKNGYCLPHLERVKKAKSQRAPKQKRPTRQQRGYDESHYELRKMVRARQPMCPMGCNKPGVELHHKDGNQRNREDSNLVMLCKKHHGEVSYRQHGGAGYRIDFHPSDFKRPPVPVKVICGPPGSGKTHYVRARAAKGDRIIDLDEIRARLSGLPLYRAGKEWLKRGIAVRNQMIRDLVNAGPGVTAWLIISGQKITDRRFWRDSLGAEIIVLETPPEVCIDRIKTDPDRPAERMNEFEGLINRWWSEYVTDFNDTRIH